MYYEGSGSNSNKKAIDDLIVATSTCLSAPSVDSHLIQRLGLLQDVNTICIGLKGCAGGALAIIDAIARAKAFDHTSSVVLVDVHSYLMIQPGGENPEKGRALELVLFGDEASATLLENRF